MTKTREKVALVTGASGGIGAACAAALRDEGMRVFTAQRREAAGFESICCDLADPEVPDAVIKDVVAQAGHLDVLVNNAGMMLEAVVDALSLEQWQQTLALNLTAPFLLIKHALPHLIASKGAIVSLVKTAAFELAPDNIRVNAVAPGATDTPMMRRSQSRAAAPEAAREYSRNRHALGRFGKPEEIANGIAHLLSDEASFTTGSVLTIDGGWRAA